jgi:hypothetical protein
MNRSNKDKLISEITLRKYELPDKNDISRRELVRKLCLSLGLLQSGDSRDIIVDIFQVIISSRKSLSAKTIMDKVKKERLKQNLLLTGLTYPNLCRQLRRLKQLMIIEVKADKYRLNEGENLKKIFNKKIVNYYLDSIIERINEYIELLKK